MRLKTLLII